MMSDALKSSGRDIVFSISEYGLFKSHDWAPEFANLWRTTDDLIASFDSILRTLDLQENLYPYSKPGAWNDPDMLQVGNGSLTLSENRTHMYLWAVLNAPLMAGNDLIRMSDEVRDLLIHPGIIAIDQDWGGHQGRLVYSVGEAQVWSKPMSDGSKASVLLSRGETKQAFKLAETTNIEVREEAGGVDRVRLDQRDMPRADPQPQLPGEQDVRHDQGADRRPAVVRAIAIG